MVDQQKMESLFLGKKIDKVRPAVGVRGATCGQGIKVILWGGMNSWFYSEFMFFSMGSISANIADNRLKIDYGM